MTFKEDIPSRADSREKSLQAEITLRKLERENDEPALGGGPSTEVTEDRVVKSQPALWPDVSALQVESTE